MREIEKQLVGNLMWTHSSEFGMLTEELSAECFTDPVLRAIFTAMKSMDQKGIPVNDPILVKQEMDHLGHNSISMEQIVEYTADANPLLNTRAYIQTIIEQYQRRTLMLSLKSLQAQCQDNSIPVQETISNAVNILTQNSAEMTGGSVTLNQMMTALTEHIDNNIVGRTQSGLLTGLRRLDHYGGLHTGDLVILAAESSQGKTAMALTIATNAATLSNAQVAIYSLEMSALQLTARMVSRQAMMPASVIMHRPLKPESLKVVDRSIGTLAGIGENIHFDENALSSITTIIASIRRHVARYRTNIVIIDYLQILNLNLKDTRNHELALAEAARSLQRLAKQLDIVIILLSQLNRDNTSHLPTVDRLRGSGQINEAADLTLLVYRPEVFGCSYPSPFTEISTHGTAMLCVAKDRFGGYGGVGECIVAFKAQTTTFEDLDLIHNS